MMMMKNELLKMDHFNVSYASTPDFHRSWSSFSMWCFYTSNHVIINILTPSENVEAILYNAFAKQKLDFLKESEHICMESVVLCLTLSGILQTVISSQKCSYSGWRLLFKKKLLLSKRAFLKSLGQHAHAKHGVLSRF